MSVAAAAPSSAAPIAAPAPAASHALAIPAATPGLVGRFLRFGLVGASGVVVNALVLLSLVELFGWPVLGASLVAIELSTLSNWFLNRHWTWKDRDDSVWHSLSKYHGVAVVGMAIQWVVLATTVATLDVHYLVGTVLGVAAATLWNFAGNHLMSFRSREAKPLPRWALYAISAGIQLVIAAVLAHPWDTFVFQRSVQDLLLHGLTPYQVAQAAPDYTYWGGSLPAIPLWYAYPPLPLALMTATYFPAALGWIPGAWVGRLLIRLPFIAATLGVAAVARRLLLTAPNADGSTAQRADQAERLLLLNPLFIAIAAIWGQFEALILLLLLLSVVALRKARYGRSGAWWALAVCVKIFPLYLVPLLAVHLHRQGGRKAVLRFGAVAAAVGAAINLPFLLWSPKGFVQQVFLMHGARSPARLAPLAYLDNLLELISEAWPRTLPAPAVWSQWLGAVSLVLVIAVLLAVAAASRRKPLTEGRLLEWIALTFLGGLLATKVLNEQYLILPLGLLLIARAHPQRTLKPGLGRFVAIGSWAVVAAGLLGGLNILFAVPEPIAKTVFGGLAPETIGKLAGAFGTSAAHLKTILAWATGLFLLGPALYGIHRVGRPVVDGLLVLERGLMQVVRRAARGSARMVPATRPAVLAAGILVLCMAPLGVALAGGITGPAPAQPLATGERWVFAEISTATYNPTNDMDRAAGTWEGAQAQPEGGYYNMNAHQAQRAVGLVGRAGFDGIIIGVHPYYPNYAATLRRVSEAEGMPYALGVDLGAARSGPIALEAATARQVRGTLDSPSVDFWQGAHHIVAPDGQCKVVFLSGIERVQPTFSLAERRFVLDAWLATQPTLGDLTTLQAGAAPRSLGDLLRDDATASLWRIAYAAGLEAWWSRALATHENLCFLTDATLPVGATGAWLGPRSAAQPVALDAPSQVRFTTLQGILAPETVRPGWVQAFWTEADGVVVPWNDFRHGSAVEPTVEHGRATLEETARWIQQFRAPRIAPAEDQGGVGGLVEQVADAVSGGDGRAPMRRADNNAALLV